MGKKVSSGHRAGKVIAPGAQAPLTMAYIVPENRWGWVPNQAAFEKFVTPFGSGVLVPGDESRPVPGMMKLALLRATLDAMSEGAPYARAGVAGFAVPIADASTWAWRSPPSPVQDALQAFVTAPGWPQTDDPLILKITMLMPPSIVEAGHGFGGEVAL